MRRSVVLAASLALPVLLAAAPGPLAPAAPWTLNFAETQCLASRDYRAEKDAVTLGLKPSPYGDLFEVVLLSRGSGSRYAYEVSMTVRIDGGAPITTTALVYRAKDGRRLTRGRLPIGAVEQLRTGTALTLGIKGEKPVALTIKGSGGMMREMNNCLTDLQDHWNISVPRKAALQQHAEGSIKGVFTPDDYPAQSIDGRSEGLVTMAMLIDEAGKVTDCTLTGTSGHAALDLQSCARVMARAQYKPAIGADGKPARSAVTGRVIWRIAN